jgi:hypothetical protein
MGLKHQSYQEEIEHLKSLQHQQQNLQSKLRMSEKTRLELLSSLCESEATIKSLKMQTMKLQEDQENCVVRERQLIEENDKMWSSRLKLLQENFEKDKQLLLMKLEKEQQMSSEKEKLRELSHRSNSDACRPGSDLANQMLPTKVPALQSISSTIIPQKQGEHQACKKPRASTPNTSRKTPANSLQVAAVNSVKSHVLKQLNDNESDEFVPENSVPITEDFLPWNKAIEFSYKSRLHKNC